MVRSRSGAARSNGRVSASTRNVWNSSKGAAAAPPTIKLIAFGKAAERIRGMVASVLASNDRRQMRPRLPAMLIELAEEYKEKTPVTITCPNCGAHKADEDGDCAKCQRAGYRREAGPAGGAAVSTSTTLPSWASDILASVPKRGDGLNRWLLRASLALRRCERSESEIAETLRCLTVGEAIKPGEIERAVLRSAEYLSDSGATPAAACKVARV